MTHKLTQQTAEFIRQHQSDDVKKLALQARNYPEVDMPMALTQIAGRQISASKLPSWHAVEGILYPQHLSMEQCSSELTARYKATLVSGDRMADLTGGFGIDCSFLARQFEKADYVERQEALCSIARHNFLLLGLNHIEVHHADGVEFLKQLDSADCIFLDPARRDKNGGKTVSVADCEPDAGMLEPLLLEKAPTVLLKLSPMLDISLALQALPHTSAVHIVSVSNECKETLLLLKRTVEGAVPICCANLTGQQNDVFVFTREEEAEAICPYTSQIGLYLYEPNASLLKAGAYKILAQRFALKKLHPNSHLYTSDTVVPEFPGRVFEVKGESSLNKKELKQMLGEQAKANLTVRNFPASVAELRKRIKLKEGGDTYLFATTLSDESKKLIICKKFNA